MSGKGFFTINNINDYNLALNVDLILISCDIDFDVLTPGYGLIPGSVKERVNLGNVSVNSNEVLASEKIFEIASGESTQFVFTYDLDSAYIRSMRINTNRTDVHNATARALRFKYRIKIVYTNPQTNKEEFDVSFFEKEKMVYIQL